MGTLRKTKNRTGTSTHKSYDHDVRNLAPGDEVEVYVAPERAWAPGIFDVSTAGVAYVELGGRAIVRLDGAMLMGLRRVIREPLQ